jgi:hypothetical protein
LAQTLCGRTEYCGKALLQAEAEIRRSGRGFTEHPAGDGAQAPAAARAAAVNAEQQDIRIHQSRRRFVFA